VTPTHYQGCAWRAGARAGGLILAAVLFFAPAIFLDGTTGDHVGAALFGVVFLLLWDWAVARRMGLIIDTDGVVVVRMVGRRRVTWERFAGFSLRPYRQDQVVFVKTTDGKDVRATAVLHGNWGPLSRRAIRWEDGESEDIIGRLTAHAEAASGGPREA
jgi:hypothetical protein